MASNTTNLDLVKQANNENWSNDIHNANLEKLDAFAGDCTNKNLGSFASLSALATILDTALASMRSSGVKAFQVNCTTASAPFKVLTYLCTLYKSGTNTTFAHATFRSISSSEVIIARRTGNGWGEWQQLVTGGSVLRFANITWEGTSATAGTSIVIGTVSNLIPSGATAKGIAVISIYGSSNYDWDGVVRIHGGEIRYMPRLSQAGPRVYASLLYTL